MFHGDVNLSVTMTFLSSCARCAYQIFQFVCVVSFYSKSFTINADAIFCYGSAKQNLQISRGLIFQNLIFYIAWKFLVLYIQKFHIYFF
jgi:hypothetical protein